MLLVVAASAVTASTLASRAAVSDEERALVLSRARALALTVQVGVDDVDSTLLSAVTPAGTAGRAPVLATQPLLLAHVVTGIGLVATTAAGPVVTDGAGSLPAGTRLDSGLWRRPGPPSASLVIAGSVRAGRRRLVGMVLRSPVLGPDELAAVLVTDPGLARAVSSGPDAAAGGLAFVLSSPGPAGTTPVAVMTAGALDGRVGPPVSVPAQADGARLTLTVWPTAPLPGALEAALPWIVLGVGTALWSLLAVLLLARAQSAARARALATSERRLSATVAELREANLTDRLTGLPNRAFAHLELADRLARQRPGTPSVAVIALDVDAFTQVNDALGHGRGDVALQAVAERWRRVLGPDDFLARLGSDEFVVLGTVAPGHSGQSGRLAGHLLDALTAEPVTVGDRAVNLRATAGVAVAGDSGVVAGELLRRAGTALHAAQAQAGGGWATFEPSMDSAVSQRFGVGQDLGRAIDTGQLQLAYQPLVAIAGQRLVGVEALLRWERPGHGPIPPELAVEVAEASGLIGRLGAWVLHTACAQATAWHRGGAPAAFAVGVNVSALQLAEPDFVGTVHRILAATGCQPSWLTLELTETCLIGDVDATAGTLQELRRLGCRVALDDFGTGYSSLDSVTRLPLDVLKVDRSILLPRDGDLRRAAGFLAGIRSITTTIGVAALAEGIETADQLDLVRTCGFELAQGYLYGRPQAAGHITRLLAGDGVAVTGGRSSPATGS